MRSVRSESSIEDASSLRNEQHWFRKARRRGRRGPDTGTRDARHRRWRWIDACVPIRRPAGSRSRARVVGSASCGRCAAHDHPDHAPDARVEAARVRVGRVDGQRACSPARRCAAPEFAAHVCRGWRRRARAISVRTSLADRHSGFSHSTCLPASSAHRPLDTHPVGQRHVLRRCPGRQQRLVGIEGARNAELAAPQRRLVRAARRDGVEAAPCAPFIAGMNLPVAIAATPRTPHRTGSMAPSQHPSHAAGAFPQTPAALPSRPRSPACARRPGTSVSSRLRDRAPRRSAASPASRPPARAARRRAARGRSPSRARAPCRAAPPR